MIDFFDYQTIPIAYIMYLSAIIFVIGIFGVIYNKKNIICFLLAIELILLSANINFIAFSNLLGDLSGQIFTIFILTVAAGEIAVGLSILIVFFRQKSSINVDDIAIMKD